MIVEGFDVIASLRTGLHHDSANAKLADIANTLANALQAYSRAFHGIPMESLPPERHNEILSANLDATVILHKIGRLS